VSIGVTDRHRLRVARQLAPLDVALVEAAVTIFFRPASEMTD
jgi:hypothetical protein